MSLNYFSILLSKIDLFGKAVELNFNGGGKSRTRIGGFFSILFFGFWIWSIYDVGQDIFKRKNPTTLATEVFTENPERMVLNPSTFSFAFGLEDPIFFSHYINESIYTMEVVVKQMRRQKNADGSVDLIWKDIALKTEVCTEAHFGDIAENFANLQLTQLYCLALDQPNLKEVSIEGMYESDVFDYIQISAKQCNPGTSRVPCGSDEEIEALLGGGGYFAIYFTNRAVNTKNYKAPTHRYRDVSFTMFGNNYYKEIHMYLNHLEIRSGTGWLTTDESSQKYVQFGSIDETVALKQKEGSMLDFQIRTGKIVQVYNRSYIKIQDIAAQANGLSSVALIILLIFVTPFSNLKFYESLINELFDVRILKDDISKRKGGDDGKSQGPDQGMKMTRSKTMKKEPVKKKRKHKTSLELETRVDSKPVQIEVIDSPKSFLREDTNEYEQLKNGSLLNKTKVLYRTKEKKLFLFILIYN